jgi:hypothetical protein
VDSIYHDYAVRHGKTRWVNKELFVPNKLDLLDAIFDYRAQFVYAVRHGLSVAHSCASRFAMRDGIPSSVSSSLNLEIYLDEWLANNRSTSDFVDRNSDRCFVVRYEEFVAEPIALGERLYAFLGEEWRADILAQMQTNTPMHLGDHKILATGGKIVPPQDPVWKMWPAALVRTLSRKANPMLERLGYEPL